MRLGAKRESTLRSAHGVDGHACAAEGVDVTQHRSHGDLELCRERARSHLTARLEQTQKMDESAGAHARRAYAITTEDVVYCLPC